MQLRFWNVAVLLLAARAALASPPSITIGPMTGKIMPTRSSNLPTATSADVFGAGREFVGFEVVINNAVSGAVDVFGVDASITSAIHDGLGHAIPAANITIYREAYQNITGSSYSDPANVPTGYWPDILIPRQDPIFGQTRCGFWAFYQKANSGTSDCNSSCSSSCASDRIPAGENRVLLVEILIPQDQPPGAYTGELTVTWQGGSSGPIAIHLNVRAFNLPASSSLKTFFKADLGQLSLAFLNTSFTTSSQWPDSATTPPITSSDKGYVGYWAFMTARLMLDHRLAGTMTYNFIPWSSSNWSPNWTNFEGQYAPLYNGALGGYQLTGAMPSSIPYTWTWPPNMYKTGGGGDTQAQQEHQAWANEFKNTSADANRGTAWSWWSRTFDYICDEPQGDFFHNGTWYCAYQEPMGPNTTSWDIIRANAANAHALTPDFQTMVTTSIFAANGTDPNTGGDDRNTYQTDINVLTPNLSWFWGKKSGLYNGNQSSQYTSNGYTLPNRVWWYQACDSGGCGTADTEDNVGYYPASFIDTPMPQQNRMQEWLTYRYNLGGELYWTINDRLSTSWTDSYSGKNGDGLLIYPGTTSRIGGTDDIILPSLRLKMWRAGLQDYEYLYYLGNTLSHQSDAYAVIDSLFNVGSPPSAYAGGVSTNFTAANIDNARATLASQIESLVSGRPFLTVNAQAGSGTGTVTSAPAGINCGTGGTSCSSQFDSGTQVTLTATADPGSTFAGFSGDCSSAGTTCTVTMDTWKNVTATFSQPCGSSDCFSRADSSTLGPNWDTYAPTMGISGNKATNLDANSKASRWLQSIGPDQDVSADCMVTGSGSNCGLMARWTDSNNLYYAYLDSGLGAVYLWKVLAGATTQLQSATRAISAGTYYHLRLVVQGSSISVYFNNESTPAISVTDTGLTSGNFGGLHAFASAPQTVWYSSFDIRAASTTTYLLTVAPSGSGAGTVTSTPSGISCGSTCQASFATGTQITLTAAAASGSTFSAFSGGCASTTTSCTFTIAGDTTVNAAFVANDFSQSATPSSLSAAQGSNATSTISTAVTSGSAQTVTFSASGLPSGASASFNPASLTAGASSTMTITVGSATPPGTYTVSVVGTGSSTTHTTNVTLQVTASLPPASSLTDAFTTLDTTKWVVNAAAGTAAASGGALSITPNAGTSSAAVYVTSAASYRLTGSQASAKILSVVDPAGNVNNKFTLRAPGNQNELGWYYEHGNLFAYYRVNGSETDAVYFAYAAGTHVYWRVRQSGTTVYWETSADGVNYSIQASTATSTVSFSLDSVQVEFNVRAFGSGAASSAPARYSNLNVTPVLVSSLTDPFTTLDTTRWTVSATAGTASASGGVLTITPNSGTSSAAIYVTSKGSYTLNGSHASTKVLAVVNGSVNNKFILRAPGNQNEIGWYYEGPNLWAYYRVNGTETDAGSVRYSASTHAYWRVRQSDTSVYWETSADGVNYTVQATTPASSVPFSLESVQVEFNVKAFGSGATTSAPAQYSNLNQ